MTKPTSAQYQNPTAVDVDISGTSATPNGSSGNAFLSQFAPAGLDFTSMGASAYSALLNKLSTLGLSGEALENMNSAYAKTLDFPVFSLPFMIADAAGAYNSGKGVLGTIESAVGDVAGYLTAAGVMDSSLAGFLASAAEFAGMTTLGVEVAAPALATVVAIMAGYTINKFVSATLGELNSETSTTTGNVTQYSNGVTATNLSNGDIQYDLGNGLIYTQSPNGTGSASINGDNYNFDTTGGISSASMADGYNFSFSGPGSSTTMTDPSGQVTTLSIAENSDGTQTLGVETNGSIDEMTLGVNSSGQNYAIADGSQYNFSISTDTSNNLNVATTDVATNESIDDTYWSNSSDTTQTVLNPDGSITQYTIASSGSESSMTFDSAGDEIASGQIDISGNSYAFTYNPTSGSITGEDIVDANGNQLDYTINSSGAESVTAINSSGQATEIAQLNTDGSQTDYYFDPSTGIETAQNVINADGSQTDYVINSDGTNSVTVFNSSSQVTETAEIAADGSQDDFFYDPTTKATIGQNIINADGSQTDYGYNADGTQSATILNSEGQTTETAQLNTDGSQTDIFFNPSTGNELGESFVNADGSQTIYAFNNDGSETVQLVDSSGQTNETAQINADGSQADYLLDPTTGDVIGENDINSNGSQTDYVISGGNSVSATVFNANGQTTETVQFNTDGTQVDTNFDPTTGVETGESIYYPDGSQIDSYVNSDGSETAYVFNSSNQVIEVALIDGDTEQDAFVDPGDSHPYEVQSVTNGQLANVIDYDQNTGTITQATSIAADGSSVVADYTDGVPSSVTWYNSSGEETELADVTGDNSETDYIFSPGATYAYLVQSVTNGVVTAQNEYDQDTGVITQSINASPDGSQSETNYTDGTISNQLFYNSNNQLTEAIVYDGDQTIYGYFSAGAAHPGTIDAYTNGQLSEEITLNQSTGLPEEADFYNGGPYPDEIDTYTSGPYASTVKLVDPQTGVVNTTGFYDPTTGQLTGATGGDIPGLSGYSGSSLGLPPPPSDPAPATNPPPSTPNDTGGYSPNALLTGLLGYPVDGDPISLPGVDLGGGDDGGDDGGFGFAGAQSVVESGLNSNVSQIALYGLSGSGGPSAIASALEQARQSANGTAPAATLEGAKWDSRVITWDFIGSSGNITDAAAEAAAQQAFAAWATASGLTFVEVNNPAQADINIDWGNLSTATSGVIGYTTFAESAGAMVAGQTNITLENSMQDALVAGSDGQLTYSGTEATLEQVLTHEIGHALGLADSSDPNSIMYYDLTASNRTLDGSDLTGIQSLYPSGETHGAGAVHQLIHSMAAYAPASGVDSSSDRASMFIPKTFLVAPVH